MSNDNHDPENGQFASGGGGGGLISKIKGLFGRHKAMDQNTNKAHSEIEKAAQELKTLRKTKGATKDAILNAKAKLTTLEMRAKSKSVNGRVAA